MGRMTYHIMEKNVPNHQPDEKHMYSSSKQIAHSPPK